MKIYEIDQVGAFFEAQTFLLKTHLGIKEVTARKMVARLWHISGHDEALTEKAIAASLNKKNVYAYAQAVILNQKPKNIIKQVKQEFGLCNNLVEFQKKFGDCKSHEEVIPGTYKLKSRILR